jgi:hypothetical protein
MHTAGSAFHGARRVRPADRDGDGDLDLITTASDAGDLTWWEVDGTPANVGWTPRTLDDYPTGVVPIVHVPRRVVT